MSSSWSTLREVLVRVVYLVLFFTLVFTSAFLASTTYDFFFPSQETKEIARLSSDAETFRRGLLPSPSHPTTVRTYIRIGAAAVNIYRLYQEDHQMAEALLQSRLGQAQPMVVQSPEQAAGLAAAAELRMAEDEPGRRKKAKMCESWMCHLWR